MSSSRVSFVLGLTVAGVMLFPASPLRGQAEAPGVGFIGTYKVAAAKTDPSTLPIIGAWRINFDKTLYRERMTKGVIDERVMYRVSPDGTTLVWTNFTSDRESGHVVWDRIELPRR